MNNDVQIAIDTKLDIIKNYYEIPSQFKGEYDNFVHEVMALGEGCSEYMEFEKKFADAGLNKRMEALILNFTVKPQASMSAKDSLKATKDAYKTTVDTKTGRKKWLKQGISDVAEMAKVEAESEILHQSREGRDEIEKEHPELHEARNTVNQARHAAWFLFGRKKKK